MADIVYEIGAKDKATPALNTVDKGMSRLEKSTKDLGEASERSLGKMSISIGSLAKAAGVFGAISLAAQGVRSVFGMIGQGVDDLDRVNDHLRALNTAMELNGGSSEELMTQYSTLSDRLELLTNAEAETTQALMTQAAMLGVSNDQIDDMAVAALGLSEVLGVSVEDGLKKARLATEGNFKAFEKLLPSIKEMTTDEEKLAAVLELSNRGLKMKEDRAQTASGVAEQMGHRVGTLMEAIGALISPLREVVYKGIILLSDGLVNVLTPAIESTQSLFEQWEPVIMQAIESTVNGIIAGLTMAEVIFNNFGAVVGMAFDSVMLSYETYRADTEHLFVTVLPAYVSWFIDNFYNMLETGFNAALTLVMNLGKSFGDAFAAIWDFISSGGQTDILGNLGEIAGRNLMEGFESSVEALPQIAARAMTATEKELTASIGETANKLASEYDAKMAQRTIKIGGKIGEDMATAIDLQLKKTADEVESKTDSIEKSKAATGASTPSDAILQASQSRLLTRGPGERKKDPVDVLQQVLAQQEIATEQAAIAASELAQIKNNLAANPLLTLAPTAP